MFQHVNDLALRIDLESTLTLSEAMYQQISTPEVTEKLPNKIRVIIGLPEREEPINDTIEIVDGEGAQNGDGTSSSSQSSPSKRSKSSSQNANTGSGDTGSTSAESREVRSRDSSLERQYDMGNQFT